MPTLSNEIKEFIVKHLACFDSPTIVAEAVKAKFGIAITRQHVYAYDPASSQSMSPRWSQLHAMTRERFLRDISEIGISQKAMRLRMLDRLAHRCERNSVALALAALEQAAKECGGSYENRRPVVLHLSAAQHPVPQQSLPSPLILEADPAAQQPSLPENDLLELINEQRVAAMLARINAPAPERENS